MTSSSKRMPGQEGSGSATTGCDLQKMASIEGWFEQGRTAGTGSVVTNRISQLPLHLLPPVTMNG